MSSLDSVILSEVKKIQKAQSNVTPKAGVWPVDKIDIYQNGILNGFTTTEVVV